MNKSSHARAILHTYICFIFDFDFDFWPWHGWVSLCDMVELCLVNCYTIHETIVMHTILPSLSLLYMDTVQYCGVVELLCSLIWISRTSID